MRKSSVKCALVAAMVAKHRWGTPIREDALLGLAAVAKHEYPAARDAFEALSVERFIMDRGRRGIELDNSRFSELAEFLFDECGWEPAEIKMRLKHYEGWGEHHWA